MNIFDIFSSTWVFFKETFKKEYNKQLIKARSKRKVGGVGGGSSYSDGDDE